MEEFKVINQKNREKILGQENNVVPFREEMYCKR